MTMKGSIFLLCAAALLHESWQLQPGDNEGKLPFVIIHLTCF